MGLQEVGPYDPLGLESNAAAHSKGMFADPAQRQGRNTLFVPMAAVPKDPCHYTTTSRVGSPPLARLPTLANPTTLSPDPSPLGESQNASEANAHTSTHPIRIHAPKWKPVPELVFEIDRTNVDVIAQLEI